jgi:membrane peptidoglycan carboxypeptidase
VYASNISPAAPSGEQPQCAVVLMDKDGAVRAMVGGAAYTTAKGLNRAMTRRQPGSAIKPIGVYSPAIELLGTQTVTYMLTSNRILTAMSLQIMAGTTTDMSVCAQRLKSLSTFPPSRWSIRWAYRPR